MANASVLLVMTGCATSSFNPQSKEQWLPDGALALVRPIPKEGNYPEPMARMRSSMTAEGDGLPRLIVESAKHTLTLNLPGETPVVMKAYGAYALKHGSYSVALKQTDPLWYAPPTYFLRRGMKVPNEGNKSRYMRGALGRKALFIDKQVAIHTGPVWNEEIGGIKVSEDDMARLFETVGIGTTVEVR
jgi:hypothetical protein